MTFWLSVIGATLGAASLVLHALAPRFTWAKKAEVYVDGAKDKLGN
jgi:hypothetical protein